MGRRTLIGVAVALASSAAAGAAYAAYVATTSNPTSTITAAPDWTAPTATASVIARSAGCTPTTPEYVRQGGTYYVYASVADTGNPASGAASVAADVSALTNGQSAASAAAGSFSVGGVAYNQRTGSLTANAVIVGGTKSYSLALADSAGNTRTATGFTTTVDNTAPAATDVQPANGPGGVAGEPEPGDIATFSFSEPLEPCSIVSGWDGAATTVTVRITNSGSNDSLTIRNAADTAQLVLGTVALDANVVTATATFASSTMVASGNTVVVTLGTLASGTTRSGGNGTATWTPSGSAYDRAQNAMTSTPATESGANDPNF